jgi:hypothetical protein
MPRLLTASLLPINRLAGDDPGTIADADHDHTDANWRLRHLPRSVLKGIDHAKGVAAGAAGQTAGPERAFLGSGFDSSARFSSGLFDSLPLTGQVNLITIGSFNGPSGTGVSETFAPAGVAYLSLGAPVGRLGDWAVRGALSQGGLGSWFVAGSLTARRSAEHRFVAGITYSAQRYDRSSTLGVPGMSAGSRSVGMIHGSDEWTLSPNLSVGYGLTYSWQDYLSGNGLLSPRLSVTLRPAQKYRVRAVAARYVVAPGAAEFLAESGSGAAMVLPAQRTFSPWSATEGFRAQTTDHIEAGIERDLASFILGFRAFYQHVGDQSGAVFAVAIPDRAVPSAGHYYVATLGDLTARGWSISVSRTLVGRVRGAVDYTQSVSRWDRRPDQPVMAFWVTGRDGDRQRVHDLTTSIETDIRPTATRVYVLYKVNTGFMRDVPSRGGSGIDSRFDVQVNQALPFLSFTSADWELLLSVCNLFRDTSVERSLYDELLVVRPPKRVVGGVRVRF